jgi:hypothetical protein
MFFLTNLQMCSETPNENLGVMNETYAFRFERRKTQYSALFLILFGLAFGTPASAGVFECGSGATCVTSGGAVSATGTFGTSEDIFLEPFTLSGNTAITVQTWGFGGGTNAAGAGIPSGGFDSLVALFSGTPAAATILMNAGNPVGSDPATTQFFSGCPPAGKVSIGSESLCGDNKLTVTLGAGSYILLLTDADFEPAGFNPGSSSALDLTDPNNYGDLTGGVFQTCNDQGVCITPNANFAVDLSGGRVTGTPEPGSFLLLGSGLVVLIGMGKRRSLRSGRSE